MNYLILHEGNAFYTNYYDKENNYVEGMIVFNLLSHTYTLDGDLWRDIDEDSL